MFIYSSGGIGIWGFENKKGTLRRDAHADLVIPDKLGTVLGTWFRGKTNLAEKFEVLIKICLRGSGLVE